MEQHDTRLPDGFQPREGHYERIVKSNPGRFEPMAEIATVPGARTGLFVAETGRLYVAIPQRGPRSAEILEYSVQASDGGGGSGLR
jgi:hypothetical protein